MENLMAEMELVSTKCFICELNDSKIIGAGKDYEYDTSNDIFVMMKCKSCGLVYLNPRPSISTFERIYPQNYHAINFSSQHFGIVYQIRSWLEAKRFMSACDDLQANARILDVGCGDGFHLNLLRRYGKKSWTLEGIDLDKRAVEMARKSGLVIYNGSVESINLPENSYDLAFMVQTIEHVEKPDEVMRAIRGLLKPGGKLVIVTDNTDSLDFKLFKRNYWGGYHFPRHWHLFSQNSLSKLAEKTDFQVARLGTIITPVNWVYTVHNWLVERKAPRWLIECFTLKSTVSLAAFTLLDLIVQTFHKGGLLRAMLRKPFN